MEIGQEIKRESLIYLIEENISAIDFFYVRLPISRMRMRIRVKTLRVANKFQLW